MTKEDMELFLNLGDARLDVSGREQLLRRMQERGLSFSTFYQEIEMSAPYVNTHRDISYSYEGMSLHSHAFYEILCFRTSCGAEYLVGSHRYSLQKGDILMIRPGVSHGVILPENLTIPYERDIIWLSPVFLDGFQKLQGLPPISYEKDLPTYLIRTADSNWAFLCDWIRAGVREEERKQDCWQTAVLGNTLQVLSQLRRAFLSQTVPSLIAEKPDILDQIIAYIDSHYVQKLTLTEIARLFYVSDRTVSSLFRKRLGVSFYQFLTRRRLIAAKELILKGLPLESVGEQTGFGDYSAFFRAFKSEFGISPREFKKLKDQKSEAAYAAAPLIR